MYFPWKYRRICEIALNYFLCLVTQLRLTLCDPMDYSPPGSFAHGDFQARILEWVSIPSSRGSSQSRDWAQVSHIADGFFTIWATREALILRSKDSFQPHVLSYARLPCPSLSPRVCSKSCPLSQWCHPTFWVYSQLTNNIVIFSGEEQRDSTIHTRGPILPQTPLPSRLPHNVEQSSLCYIYSRSLLVIHFIFFSFIFISWRLITLQYCSGFCHTLTWISHGFTWIPHPNPPWLSILNIAVLYLHFYWNNVMSK